MVTNNSLVGATLEWVPRRGKRCSQRSYLAESLLELKREKKKEGERGCDRQRWPLVTEERVCSKSGTVSSETKRRRRWRPTLAALPFCVSLAPLVQPSEEFGSWEKVCLPLRLMASRRHQAQGGTRTGPGGV